MRAELAVGGERHRRRPGQGDHLGDHRYSPYAATVSAGGSGYSVGQYVKVSGGATESPGYAGVDRR